MKRLFTILATVLLNVIVFAQTPEKMSYQAVIYNANGELVKSQQVGMQISLLQTSESGEAVYTETHNATTNANGLVTVEIGNGTTSDDFSIIDWSANIYFIKTETDPEGGTNYTITGISQLLSVPYALHAKKAETVTTEIDPVYSASQAANITTSDITNLSNLSGTNTGDQDISGIATNTQAIIDTANSLMAYIDALQQKIDDLELEIMLINGEIIIDNDTNIYRIETIGNQIWMAENLKVTQYADGTAIPLVTNNTEWANLGDNDTDKAYCFYNNDENQSYGALYTYAAATNGDNSGSNVQGVCPTGWHLPSDAEWTQLEDFISNNGHTGAEGTVLKATSGWSNSGNGTDDYSFTALPGGTRHYGYGVFGRAGLDGCWWSSTQFSTSNGSYRNLGDVSSTVLHHNFNKSEGFSVRCIKD